MHRRKIPVQFILNVEELNRFSMFYEVLIKVEKRNCKAKKTKRQAKLKDSSSLTWSSIHFYLANLYVKIFWYFSYSPIIGSRFMSLL